MKQKSDLGQVFATHRPLFFSVIAARHNPHFTCNHVLMHHGVKIFFCVGSWYCIRNKLGVLTFLNIGTEFLGFHVRTVICQGKRLLGIDVWTSFFSKGLLFLGLRNAFPKTTQQGHVFISG